MRVALKQKTPAPTTPRAREREALHELDDGRLVLEHLAGDAQAFGALVDRYQTRLLNFINRTIGDRERAKTSCRRCLSAYFATCTGSTRPRSSRRGSIRSPRTWPRTSFA